MMNQQTILGSGEINGIGLHTGEAVNVRFSPAPEGHGITFRKKTDQCDIKINTGARYLIESELCSTLKTGRCEVKTVEHLMAAVNAMEIDNLLIEIDADELPIMDGSSKDFVELFNGLGLKEQKMKREFIKIDQELKVEDACGNSVTVSPSEKALFSFEIDFPNTSIGKQNYKMELTKESFISEIADARTFGFMKNIVELQAKGLAKGGSLDNAIVIGNNDKVLNKEGLRYRNEFVKHKLLDSVGDLALIGKRVIGHFQGVRSSHMLTARMIKKLVRNKDCWHIASYA